VVRKSSVSWNITPCGPLKVNRHFGGKYRLHNEGVISQNIRGTLLQIRFPNPEKEEVLNPVGVSCLRSAWKQTWGREQGKSIVYNSPTVLHCHVLYHAKSTCPACQPTRSKQAVTCRDELFACTPQTSPTEYGYLSIYLSICLWLYSPFVGPWPLFQFLNPITNRQDSLDGGSARSKVATYKYKNINTK
jgi:hypothetical protein